MLFGEKLKKYREENSMTQEDIADLFEADLTRQAVSKWERGDGYPDWDKVLFLAVKMDISLDELFADELSYLRRGGTPFNDNSADNYPGAFTALKVLAECLSKL